MLYGGVAQDSNVTRKEAYKRLLYGGDSGFNATLSGGRNPDGQYSRLDAHGFYWTAEATAAQPGFTILGRDRRLFYQQDGGEQLRAFSVRCVKSNDSLK